MMNTVDLSDMRWTGPDDTVNIAQGEKVVKGSNQEHYGFHPGADGNYSLLILDLVDKDSGVYKCMKGDEQLRCYDLTVESHGDL